MLVSQLINSVTHRVPIGAEKAQDDAFKESEAGVYWPSIPCSESQEKQNS